MDEENTPLLDDNIRIYLNEIAEKLFSNHAVVMIGAGFSKNAKPNYSNCSGFSDWNELGTEFYKKIYGTEPKQNEYFLDVLKLADEVEATFGRSALEEILQQKNPDLKFSPSELHKRLLELPWVDVFTTNYDTLLERTSYDCINQKYSIITTKQDLVFAEKPRIVKLHGSFPSTRPFIITGEDFRKYPMDFAPFVNTVQQSMLENTMCLIGFSGDDPNFLKWIGWIRDNLKDNVPKLYLIGSFDFTDAQLQLLHKRNIVVINLKPKEYTSCTNNHYYALDCFFSYLERKKVKLSFSDWPYVKSKIFISDTTTINPDIIGELVDNWASQRETYPGWVIMPEAKRSIFWLYTEHWLDKIISENQKLPDKLKFNFYYELIWRLDKCLFPIQYKLASEIEKVLDFYGNDKRKLISMYFALLKCYRQNGRIDDWNKIISKFNNILSICTSEEIAELNYEKTLSALFFLDYGKAKETLSLWKEDPSLPFINAKRAGLIAELGDTLQAFGLLKQAVQDIRKLQSNINDNTDISLYSQESYILILYQNILFTIDNIQRKNEKVTLEKYEKENTKRLNTLKNYDCNPYQEEALFKNGLYENYVEPTINETKHEFDFNESSIIYRLGKSTKESRKAVNFLIYLEKIGTPISINTEFLKYVIYTKETKAAIKRLATDSLYWCISLCCRIADEKIVGDLFSRNNLWGFPSEYVNELCNNFINILKENKENINSSIDENGQINFGMNLASVLPEVISRLCTKCNFYTKKEILNLLIEIYNSNARKFYKNKEILRKRLLTSLSKNEQRILLPEILKIIIPNNLSKREIRDMERIIPSDGLLTKINQDRNILISSDILEPYFELLNSKDEYIRSWSLEMLVYLEEENCLNEEYKQKLIDELWRNVDSFGLPRINENLLKCNILNYPIKKGINVNILFKKYLFSFTTNNKISLDEFLTFYQELFCFNEKENKKQVWNNDETEQLLNFINSFFEKYKYVPQENYIILDSKQRKINDCFYYIRRNLSIMSLNGNLSQYITDEFIKKFELHNFPHLELKFSYLVTEKLKSLLPNLISSLENGNSIELVDSLYAISALNKRKTDNSISPIFEETLNAFLLCILFKRSSGIESCLSTLLNMIELEFLIFSEDNISLLTIILSKLEKETSLEINMPIWTGENKLNIREKVSRLAFDLYKQNEKDGKEQPQEVLRWKEISQSEEEFSEIRNQWELP